MKYYQFMVYIFEINLQNVDKMIQALVIQNTQGKDRNMATATLHDTQQTRLESLRNKHTALSNRVKEAQTSPSIPDDVIQLLKKQKLMVKEQIERIRASGQGV